MSTDPVVEQATTNPLVNGIPPAGIEKLHGAGATALAAVASGHSAMGSAPLEGSAAASNSIATSDAPVL